MPQFLPNGRRLDYQDQNETGKYFWSMGEINITVITVIMGSTEVMAEIAMLATIIDLHAIDITMLMIEDSVTPNKW